MKKDKLLTCRSCKTPLRKADRFCPECGTARLLTREESAELCRRNLVDLAMKAEGYRGVSLWNPRAAAWWSVLLTPAFGATIHALNWKAMGEQMRYRFSLFWAMGSLSLFAIYPALRSVGVTDGVANNWTRIVTVSYLVLWYALSGRLQVAEVKAAYGGEYPRRSWIKAFVATAGAIVALLLVITILGALASRGVPA